MSEAKTETRTIESPTTATKKLIKTTRQFTKRKFTAEDKIRIVMEGIRGDDPVTVLCRRESIHANIYYKWLKDFMEAGKARLKGEETRGATGSEVDELQRENGRLKELVADLSVQVLVLKKSLL